MLPLVAVVGAYAINEIANKEAIVIHEEDSVYTEVKDNPRLPLRVMQLHDSMYPNSTGHLVQIPRGSSITDFRHIYADRKKVNDRVLQFDTAGVQAKNFKFWNNPTDIDNQPTITVGSGWINNAIEDIPYASYVSHVRRVPYTVGFGEDRKNI